MAKEKILVMNAKDLWSALTDCSAMSTLRQYFIGHGVYPETAFEDVEFDRKGNVIFKVSHSKFPDAEQSSPLKLPNLQKRNIEK